MAQRISTADLAALIVQQSEALGGLTAAIGQLINAPVATATTAPADKTPLVSGEATTGITALRLDNNDTWPSFEAVCKAQLKKAGTWSADKGVKCYVSYSYSANRKRPFVMFGKTPRSGAITIATIEKGKVSDLIGGLPI